MRRPARGIRHRRPYVDQQMLVWTLAGTIVAALVLAALAGYIAGRAAITGASAIAAVTGYVAGTTS